MIKLHQIVCRLLNHMLLDMLIKKKRVADAFWHDGHQSANGDVQCYRYILCATLHEVVLLQYFGLHLQIYKEL